MAGGALLFGIVFSYPVLAHLSGVGGVVPLGPRAFYDWDVHEQLQFVPYLTVTRYHQFPFWNPYKCGGIPMFANPQSQILTPFFLVHLIFGPFVGFNLTLPLHLSIGWSGGYLLARVLGMRPLAGVASGSVFMASSWFFLHIAVGHAIFLSAAYLPWILVFVWRSFESRRMFPAAIAGAFVALILGEGGIYQISQAFLIVGLLAGVLCIMERTAWPIATVLVFGAFAAGFSAIKLIPAYEFMRTFPRPWTHVEFASFRTLATALFSRNQVLERPRIMEWSFWEYGAYIGPIAALLAIVGIASSWRRALPWALAAAALFALAMGTSGLHYPWILLHKLPVFSSERVVSRMLIPFTLVVSVLVAMGLEFLELRLGGGGPAICSAVVAAMLLDFWVVGVPALRHVVEERRQDPPVAPSFVQYRNPSPLVTLPATMANQGSLNCYEFTDIRTEAVGINQPGYAGEQNLLGSGTVKVIRWSPNILDFRIDAPAPTILLVNQNYYPAWQLTRGRGRVFSNGGLLAVGVPAGSQKIRLRYKDAKFAIGLIITVLTAIAAALIWLAEQPQIEQRTFG